MLLTPFRKLRLSTRRLRHHAQLEFSTHVLVAAAQTAVTDRTRTVTAHRAFVTHHATHRVERAVLQLVAEVGDLLTMINNSYEYAGNMLGIKLGKIEEDYEADFMLVPYKPFTEMDDTNAFGHIFYGLYPSLRPNDVYASGKLLLKY